MNNKIIFKNARIFNGDDAELIDGCDVQIDGDSITSVSKPDAERSQEDLEIIDCRGHFLMPGLIDAHVHVYASTLNITRAVQSPMSYVAHFAARFMKSSLDRGFTTLRDVGGADVGLATAIKEGLLGLTPRLFYGGRVISQTGGHGDFRPGDHALDNSFCGCSHSDSVAIIADGVDAVRKAVREELRRGASHIKIMASGGVASPTDPLDNCQYSDEEIRVAVEEAARAGFYVAAHCHPKESIRRAAEFGVRSIEHATLIDKETAEIVASSGAFVVPTLVTGFTLSEEGEKLGFPPVSLEKMRRLIDKMLVGLEIMKQGSVRMGFGTDLLGHLHIHQSREFTLRAQVLTPIDILRSACTINAELLNQSGRLGCIHEGAAADLLVVDGNPLEDISLLADPQKLLVIMKDGQFHKNVLQITD